MMKKTKHMLFCIMILMLTFAMVLSGCVKAPVDGDDTEKDSVENSTPETDDTTITDEQDATEDTNPEEEETNEMNNEATNGDSIGSNIVLAKYTLEATGTREDMSEKIEAMLNEHGICILGKGKFYVTGVDMPNKTTLMGIGASSEIVLDRSVKDGYAVRMGSYCTVKNLSFIGSDSNSITLPTTVEKRHGILFKGTSTTGSNSNSSYRNSIIDGCFIRSFTGGGITCVETGYDTVSSLTATNCHITNCGAGINIPYFSEYHEFTNMLCAYNLYGCVNNGGNNTFVNCGFNSNKVGFLIDNSTGASLNVAHGNVVGCTFNHSGGNTGVGIKVVGAFPGYVFTGCNLGYSTIEVLNSDNITFADFNFLANVKIKVTGSKTVMFANCLFGREFELDSTNKNLKFVNCYMADGTQVTG